LRRRKKQAQTEEGPSMSFRIFLHLLMFQAFIKLFRRRK
jgi:hypothetical protein